MACHFPLDTHWTASVISCIWQCHVKKIRCLKTNKKKLLFWRIRCSFGEVIFVLSFSLLHEHSNNLHNISTKEVLEWKTFSCSHLHLQRLAILWCLYHYSQHTKREMSENSFFEAVIWSRVATVTWIWGSYRFHLFCVKQEKLEISI